MLREVLEDIIRHFYGPALEVASVISTSIHLPRMQSYGHNYRVVWERQMSSVTRKKWESSFDE